MRSCLAAILLCLPCLGMAQTEVTSADFASQTITIALNQEPPQLNGMKATDQVSIFTLGHVMEGLTRHDRRGNIVPGVAERWEVTDTEATFWLRKNARWSDGSAVTADDFITAWQNVLKPATASEYAFILYPLLHGEAINKGELDPAELWVKALDEHTLHIRFERPTGYFEKLVAFVTYFPVKGEFLAAAIKHGDL